MTNGGMHSALEVEESDRGETGRCEGGEDEGERLSKRASSTASLAPSSALCLMSATLAAREAPPVSWAMRARRKGVTSRPSMPRSAASASAVSIAACTIAASASASSGIGAATSRPPAVGSWNWARTTEAASSALATERGVTQPDERVKKAGNSVLPMESTGTPCVSSTSSVRPMSRIDLTPAHTTATGVRPSSTRSAETSIES
mmetsp:Transcript_31589/g.73526  ORF Transcript_31589/g.73526 Transcript_31589/m.73526 type:complete len:204 (+) Transcript_31589:1503-2114(+)